MATGTAPKRLQKELQQIRADSSTSVIVDLVENNIFHWTSTIVGPDDTPYANGHFVLDISFPPDYPFSPPKMKFLTKVYHCNINANGNICLDILKEQWSPGLTVSKLIISIRSFLSDPNPDHPLVSEVAREFKTNRSKHDDTAREWTLKYAQPNNTAADTQENSR